MLHWLLLSLPSLLVSVNAPLYAYVFYLYLFCCSILDWHYFRLSFRLDAILGVLYISCSYCLFPILSIPNLLCCTNYCRLYLLYWFRLKLLCMNWFSLCILYVILDWHYPRLSSLLMHFRRQIMFFRNLSIEITQQYLCILGIPSITSSTVSYISSFFLF